MLSSGEEKAWEILSSLEPSVVCRNSNVSFDRANKHYRVRSFSYEFFVDPNYKTIKSINNTGEYIIVKHGYFFVHSCLWYLIRGKDIPLSGRLVKPANLQGGDLFFRGSHILPLEYLAQKYGKDAPSFFQKGRDLSAEAAPYGDASIRLFPLPKIPVILILWLEDEEFPARADLLFDSSSGIHLPLDMLWSLAMLSILVMM